MKICYLANASITHTHKMANYFADVGHEVHIISFEEPNVTLDNVTFHFIKTNKKLLYFSFLYKAFQIKKIIKDISPDIVHAHYVIKYGLIGSFLGFHPFLITVLGSDILLYQSSFSKFVLRYVLNKADCVHCDGDNTENKLMELISNHEKINKIYFGIDTQLFTPERKGQNISTKLYISDSPIVISDRNLKKIYDVESLIMAAPLVIEKIHDVKFLIGGSGPEESNLRALAKSLNVSDSIKFIGFIPNKELPYYLVSSDIYVSTSLTDAGLAVSTAEAMSCGLPVIVTNFGDNNKWIQDSINGFIVPLKDPKSLALKIIFLLENQNLKSKFGEINREIIENNYDYYKEMKKMENIYSNFI